MDCIFCKIISGQLPCMKVYEDEHALVFMDIAGDVVCPNIHLCRFLPN